MRDGIDKVKAKQKRNRDRVTLARRLEYAGLRIVIALLRIVPIEFGAAFMGRLWRLVGPSTHRHSRALRNLALAVPDYDEAERQRIAAAQWDNLGRTFAEALQVDRLIADLDRLELVVDAAAAAAFSAPGGLVLASLHSGNWEVAAYPIRRYRSVAGLYQRLSNPLSDQFVAALRGHVFDGGLFTKGAKTPGHIMQWVRAGNAMAMLADHRESRGIEVSFFGRPTTANPFPAMVARRLGVPLIAGRAVRLPGSRFRVDACRIAVPQTNHPEHDVAVATQALLDCFESWIRDRPGEWMWMQDRWRQPRNSLADAAEADDLGLAGDGAEAQI